MDGLVIAFLIVVAVMIAHAWVTLSMLFLHAKLRREFEDFKDQTKMNARIESENLGATLSQVLSSGGQKSKRTMRD